MIKALTINGDVSLRSLNTLRKKDRANMIQSEIRDERY